VVLVYFEAVLQNSVIMSEPWNFRIPISTQIAQYEPLLSACLFSFVTFGVAFVLAMDMPLSQLTY
jgi:hypothetical protein